MNNTEANQVSKTELNPLGLTNLTAMGKSFFQVFGKISTKKKRLFFDIIFLVGFLCCLVPGPLPALTTPASILLVLCFTISLFDENFYLYFALFIYMRYKMLVGESPAYRILSYLAVIKFLLSVSKTKFNIIYLPAIFVFLLHSVFAVPKIESLRIGFNVIVDCIIIYMVVLNITADERILRKFFFAFMLGGIASGIFGWTSEEGVKVINIAGAGVDTVKRNFGALSDSNFAGLIYSLCIMCVFTIKKIPKLIKLGFIAAFLVMLMQTVSLSAMGTLLVMLTFWIILQYRKKAAFILVIAAFLFIALIAILLTIPQFRQIEAVADLIVRLTEKLSYISRGRWDLLTTGRTEIWEKTLPYFTNGSIITKLIGGNVVTVFASDASKGFTACHNSYLQSIMNFGIVGTILVYTPVLGNILYKLYKHFSQPKNYKNEDIKIISMLFVFSFIVFGMTVDFFIDWPFMILYFI